MSVPSFVTKYGELVYRISLFLAVTAVLFLNSRYVTRSEFIVLQEKVQQVSAAVVDLNTSIKIMVEQNRINERQDKAIDDHETRMRVLEREHR